MNYETFTGEPVSPGVPVVLGPFTLRSFGLSAQAPLLDLSLWRRWRGSKALAESSKAEAEQTREEISALVVGQYLLALRAEAQFRTRPGPHRAGQRPWRTSPSTRSRAAWARDWTPSAPRSGPRRSSRPCSGPRPPSARP
ncbi:TolC family protein [uncultured Tolumonas sp.]|uniref:TolC family protein n=1 Tax=uncultured Tolumonas sp. TaxID=263765 RepID=UPI003747AA6A